MKKKLKNMSPLCRMLYEQLIENHIRLGVKWGGRNIESKFNDIVGLHEVQSTNPEHPK